MAEEEQPRALKQLALFKKVAKTKKGKKPKPEGFAASLKKGENFNIIDRQPDEASSLPSRPAVPRCPTEPDPRTGVLSTGQPGVRVAADHHGEPEARLDPPASRG